MGKCPGCGAYLPHGCAKCPPQVIPCPYCGTEVLIEPMSQGEVDELLKERSRRR